MTPLFFSALLLMAPAPKAPTLDDGFYEVVEKGDGTRFPCNDGRTLLLGKNLGKEFGTATIRSRNNDNTQFGVMLKGAAKLWDGPEPLAARPRGRQRLLATLGQLDPQFRRHPRSLVHRQREGTGPKDRQGPQVRTRAAQGSRPPARGQVDPGQGSLSTRRCHHAQVRADERGQGERHLPHRRQPARHHATISSASSLSADTAGERAFPDTGDPNNFGGKSWTKTLKPGETYAAEVPLNKWFDFAEPDSYRVTGVWSLHLEDPGRGGFDPGIWDDVVCGECIVRGQGEVGHRGFLFFADFGVR